MEWLIETWRGMTEFQVGIALIGLAFFMTGVKMFFNYDPPWLKRLDKFARLLVMVLIPFSLFATNPLMAAVVAGLFWELHKSKKRESAMLEGSEKLAELGIKACSLAQEEIRLGSFGGRKIRWDHGERSS